MNTADYYSDPNNCYKEIGIARKVFTNSKMGKDKWDAVEKSLGLMYIYCPEELQIIVNATMSEMEMRKPISFIIN